MANETPARFHQAVCKTAIAPERCIIAPFILKGLGRSELLANHESFLPGPVRPPADGMRVSTAPSPGHRSAPPGRSGNFPASRLGYRDDECGPCGSTLVSGAPTFSPGAGSSGASSQLYLFGLSTWSNFSITFIHSIFDSKSSVKFLIYNSYNYK